jgi:hypothetical protein
MFETSKVFMVFADETVIAETIFLALHQCSTNEGSSPRPFFLLFFASDDFKKLPTFPFTKKKQHATCSHNHHSHMLLSIQKQKSALYHHHTYESAAS